MRIISGKYKGHPLVAFKADHIRPTTDRVKETEFNILMGELDGARVVDLFCGTGNLGLEALSRGARHVTFVEKNPQSIKITRQNIEKLKVPASDYTIVQMNVLEYLAKYSGDAFDIIFADPPFTEKMAHDVLLAASESAAFGDSSIMAIESEKKERLDELYGSVFKSDARSFGDKILSFFRKGQVESV